MGKGIYFAVLYGVGSVVVADRIGGCPFFIWRRVLCTVAFGFILFLGKIRIYSALTQDFGVISVDIAHFKNVVVIVYVALGRAVLVVHQKSVFVELGEDCSDK